MTTRSRSKRRGQRPQAQLLPFKQRGGARPGAGRKPKGQFALVSHAARAKLASRFPVLVTVKMRQHLPRLRSQREYEALRGAFSAGCDRHGFRLCHYVILNDHLHFLVEAPNRERLVRGLQGLLIRIARRLNKLWGRRGGVFADRYHDRILRSPREVRHALRYVLQNGKKHAAEGREVAVCQAIDTFSSAPWFDGWRETLVVLGLEAVIRPVTDARTWMLTIGWRRLGLLGVDEYPRAAS